ncbi:MAG: PAS domain-containing protein [Methanomassiliicoccaceae archaeon]|nr:PAS domain-containing protein [Methanomassiliicoccaceae archaeon]
MGIDGVSAENLLNIIMDEVDEMLIINDSDRNVIWMNRAAQRNLGISLEDAVGSKCYELFGATCCCDSCVANHTLGGPHHRGRKFKCTNIDKGYECRPAPYYKEGKLKIVIQRIRSLDKNE